MTEQTSFGGLAVATDPRSATPLPEVDETPDANKRKLAVVGAIVAVLVVLIAAFFLMKGGSATPPPAAAPTSGVPAATTTTTGAAAAPATKLPKSFKGVIGRDPFKALYTAPVTKSGDGSTTGSTPTTTGTTTGGTTTPTDSTTGTTTGTTTPVTTTPGTTTPVSRPVWIRLTSLTANSATFDVGFSDHKNLKVKHFTVTGPAKGTPSVFARNFALLRVNSQRAVLQYGDGTPFVLDMQHALMIVN